MGTDRSTRHEGPCRCGKGKVKIDYCTPDHGWPTATPFWYESNLDCPICKAIFEIQDHDGKLVYVSRSDIQKNQVIRQQSEIKSQQLLSSSSVKQIELQLFAALSNRRTKKAKHDFLKSAQLNHTTYQTFLKHWMGEDNWIKWNFRVRNLREIMAALGIHDQVVLNEVNAIEKLEQQASARPSPVGGPIYSY